MLQRLLRTCLLTLAVGLTAPTVGASEPAGKSAEGRPEVRLNRLDFPTAPPASRELEQHLRNFLKREARKADWGAGRDNQIEYRFGITHLEVHEVRGVLHVRCAAVGQLPGGERARSDLTFGGAPSERTALVRRVVEVVARGVMTRLAELERQRRGLR